MMNRSKRVGLVFAKAVAAGVLLATAGLASAGFVAIGGDQVRDTTTNLIWLKNWNLGAGSSFDNGSSFTDGRMTWGNATSWAASLTTGGVTAGTWRLPTGDLGQLAGPANEFLQLWNDVGNSLVGLKAQFSDVQDGSNWSGSEYAPDLARAWRFDPPINGEQSNTRKTSDYFAVAVRSGDVAAVSEPESMALVLVGLLAAGASRRRRSRTQPQPC